MTTKTMTKHRMAFVCRAVTNASRARARAPHGKFNIQMKELHILISYDTHICASQCDDIHLQNGPAHILNHIHQTKGIIEPKTTSQANASGKKRTKTQTI